jgi:hypothetical protein
MTDRFAGLDYVGERRKGKRIGTLWANINYEGGDVTLAPIFDGMDRLMRLDVIGDCIGLLEREYDKTLAEE